MNLDTTSVTRLYENVEKLSLFDLKQLHLAIYNLLDDPGRNFAVKRLLKPGMKIHYYEADQKIMIEAIILEIKNKRATVQNVGDKKRWIIYLCSINLQGKDTFVSSKRSSGKLDRSSLKIGDNVGWSSKTGSDLFGVIKKLNPKNAVVQLNSGETWTVHYSFLFLVMDGVSMTTNGNLLIEGEVIR